MTFEEYQDGARRTQREDMTPEQKLMHALHGLTSEVGEIHGVFQKSYQGHPLSKKKLMDETGDLLWFIAEFCDALEINLADVARHNIDKLWRRYPSGFDSVRSVNREV